MDDASLRFCYTRGPCNTSETNGYDEIKLDQTRCVQRCVCAVQSSTLAWADLWRDVWREIDAWGGLGDDLSVRSVKAHTTPDVRAGIISADDQAGNDLADAACNLVVLEHRAAASPSGDEALRQLGSHLLGSLDCEATYGH